MPKTKQKKGDSYAARCENADGNINQKRHKKETEDKKKKREKKEKKGESESQFATRQACSRRI